MHLQGLTAWDQEGKKVMLSLAATGSLEKMKAAVGEAVLQIPYVDEQW